MITWPRALLFVVVLGGALGWADAAPVFWSDGLIPRAVMISRFVVAVVVFGAVIYLGKAAGL